MAHTKKETGHIVEEKTSMDRVRRIIRYDYVGSLHLTGRGCTVAILDSGAMPHPDIRSCITEFHDFTQNHRIGMYDDCGHGTHINGILCSSGALSGGVYQGMAPGCSVINLKVLGAGGDGRAQDMIAALEWLLQYGRDKNIRIVNVSLAIYKMKDKEKLQQMRELMDALCDNGMLVITAAGNSGPQYGSLSELGESARVITVGCHDFGYRNSRGTSCEMHSGRGSLLSEVWKPDLVAPGTDINSCSFQYTKARKVRFGYAPKTGTSMAAPIVAGAAALLHERYPQIGNYMMKRKLLEGTSDMHESPAKQGHGMLNLEKMFAFSGL